MSRIKKALQRWLCIQLKSEPKSELDLYTQFVDRIVYLEKCMGRFLDTPYVLEPNDLTGPRIIRLLQEMRLELGLHKEEVFAILRERGIVDDPLNYWPVRRPRSANATD